MVYSNIGYVTLGMVVEAVTGSAYERYCRDAALKPMKAAGTIDPRLRQRASSGGWRVSAIDYARFIQVFEPGSPGLGPLARQWQDGAERRSRAYGLGIFIRRTPQGIVLNAQRPQCAARARRVASSSSFPMAGPRSPYSPATPAAASPTFAAASKPPSRASERPLPATVFGGERSLPLRL